MFQFLCEWIKNIAFYMIISTIFLEALPANCYKKYIRFFIGLVLIVLIFLPVLNFVETNPSLLLMNDFEKFEKEIQELANNYEEKWMEEFGNEWGNRMETILEE